MAASYDNEEKALPQTMRSLVPSFLQMIKSVFSKTSVPKGVRYTPDSRPEVLQTAAVTGGPQPTSTSPHMFDTPVPVHDKLAVFRRITGITSAREHRDGVRPAVNLGIYARVVKNERQALDAFKFSSRLINGCLALQLIVAASLTALGAGNGPHAAVTVFGAVNTIIAGFLTYLKGSGLPNRHKFYASSWGKVREYMEQREREFERADCPLDVEEVIRKVEDMYEEVRQDVEANEPEAYTSTGQLKRSEGITPGPLISDKSGEFSHPPHLMGGRIAAMTQERTSAFDKNNMSQTLNRDWTSRAALGEGRFSGLEEKLPGFRTDGRSDIPGHRRAEDEPASYSSHLIPDLAVDQRTQAAMETGATMMRNAKHTEAKIEDALKALTTGVERQGATSASQARAQVTSEIEEARLGAARTMGDIAERLHEAGEQRLGAARTIAARVEGALSLGMQKREKSAEDLG